MACPIRDEFGKSVVIPLSTDKKAAQVMLAQKMKEIEQRKAGIITTGACESLRPIAEVLADFSRPTSFRRGTSRTTTTAS